MLFDAVLGARPQLLDRPAGLGDADDGDIDAFVGYQSQKSREDLLIGKIAGSAEEDQGVGLGGLHRSSSWPWQFGPTVNPPDPRAGPNVITLLSLWPTESLTKSLWRL